MALSAFFVEDHTTRIVSITIGQQRPVIVMAQRTLEFDDFAGEIYFGKAATTLQEWTLVEPRSAGRFTYASYARVEDPADPTKTIPTYLVTTFMTHDAAVIWYSNNGETWSIGFSIALPVNVSAGYNGLVWHATDKRFYVLVDQVEIPPEGFAFVETISIMGSADGKIWSTIETWTTSDDSVGIRAIAGEAFRALLTKPSNDGGIPDGFQGYNESTKLLIKPAGAAWDFYGYTVDLTQGIVIEKDGAPESGGAGLPQSVWAVSFANGVWNAVTVDDSDDDHWPTDIYVSTDDGKNWEKTFSTVGAGPAGIVGGTPGEPT